jgi:hypothetical protein
MKFVRNQWREARAPVLVAVGVVLWLALALSVAAQSPVPTAPAMQPKAAAQPKAAGAPKAAKSTRKAQDSGFKLILEPRAMELLKATSDRLAAAKTLQFTAVAGYEYPSKLGPPILYSVRYDVVMQRPDRLRILMPGDGPASEFYYDGKQMIAFAPAENLAAFADAPPTVEAALIAAFKTAGIYFPFVDLLAADPYQALTDGAQLAFVVGPSAVVGGVKTDMVVWANPDVFLQIWIGSDDKLPRRIRAIFRNDPLGLRHQLDLFDWKLDAPVAQDFFVATKAQAAGRMPFNAPGPPAKAMKPLAAGKAAAPGQPK